MSSTMPLFTTVYLKQANPFAPRPEKLKSKKEQGDREKIRIAEEAEIRDKIRTAFTRYKIEIVKLHITLEREHIWWKLTLKDAADFSSLQEVQYDLDLIFNKSVMLLVNPQREIVVK